MQLGFRFSFAFKPGFKRRKDLGLEFFLSFIFFFLSFTCLKPALQKQHLQLGCRFWVLKEPATSQWAQRSRAGLPPHSGQSQTCCARSPTTRCAAAAAAQCCQCSNGFPDACGFLKLNLSPALRKLGGEGRIIALSKRPYNSLA